MRIPDILRHGCFAPLPSGRSELLLKPVGACGGEALGEWPGSLGVGVGPAGPARLCPACAPPVPRRRAVDGEAQARRWFQTEKQTLFDLQSYTGFFSFLLQVFSFGEGNVALRGSQ